jgi:NSS family neurotransmitter:Na+ symporter
VAFAQMPGGYLFSVLFFLMLSVAGITSMVGLIESVNAWIEEQFGVSRHVSALLVVGSIGALSILSILSYNVLDGLRLGDRNFNDVMDYFSNQVLLPLGGLLIAVFAGWFMRREFSRDEFARLSERGVCGLVGS